MPLAGQQQMGLYLWYLLQYRVIDELGRKASPEDLHELTLSVYPRFRELVRGSEAQLEDTFRRAFEFSPLLSPPLTAADFMIFASVALGVLLVDPSAQLAAAHPHVAAWWHRHVQRFRTEGFAG